MNTDTGKIYTAKEMEIFEKAQQGAAHDIKLSKYIQKHKPDPKEIATTILESSRDILIKEMANANEKGTLMKMEIPPTAEQLHNGKVGRNDPCPCGSGQKFKKCHWTGLHYTIEVGGKK